jgi:hypothetical protein
MFIIGHTVVIKAKEPVKIRTHLSFLLTSFAPALEFSVRQDTSEAIEANLSS